MTRLRTAARTAVRAAALWIGATVAVAACTRDLVVDPTSTITVNSFWQTPDDARGAVARGSRHPSFCPAVLPASKPHSFVDDAPVSRRTGAVSSNECVLSARPLARATRCNLLRRTVGASPPEAVAATHDRRRRHA